MKKVILAVLIIGNFLLISACKKDTSFKVSLQGNVFNPSQNQAVSNATVVLSASLISSGTYNSNYTDVATTTTDGSGNYTFSTDISGKPVGLRVTISKAGYFYNSADLSPTLFESGNSYTQNFNMYSEAFIKLHIANTSPNDSTDRITYYYTLQPSLHCSQCCSDNQVTGVGPYYQASNICKTYGNQWTKIVWTTIKYGFLNYHIDSVYCNPADTAIYNINY